MDWKELLKQAQVAAKAAQAITDRHGDRDLPPADFKAWKQHYDEATRLKSESDRTKADAEKSDQAHKDAESELLLKELSESDGDAPPEVRGGGGEFRTKAGRRTGLSPQAWASRAASNISGKALTSGSYTLPAVVVEAATDPKVARSLLELIPVVPLGENNYGFLRQTERTNNADVVKDGELKPTSVFGFDEVEDRARVVAHLSEPFPQRFLQDHAEVIDLLRDELAYGVLLGVENQVLSGDGSGENLQGLLSTTGVQQVAYAGDIPSTLRKARTALEVKDEQASAWCFNPVDAEALDLLRENGTSGDFLALARVLGGYNFVTSNGIPAGTAVLADWTQSRLFVREESRMDVNAGGDEMFDKNQVKLRAEMRVGFGIRRPQAFVLADLTA